MKVCLSESLRPVIEALAPTKFGPPKTQAVISRFLGLFEALIAAGYTYEQMAEALTAGGAQGRRGAQLSGNSLSSCIARARKGAGDRGAAEIRVRLSQVADDVRTARTSTWDQDRANSSDLSKFSQCIRDAQSHAARGEVLFGRPRRS